MPGSPDEPQDWGMVSPEMVRAQLAGAQGNVSDLERQVLERQLDSQVTGIGSVPEMKAGYWDDPKSYVQAATIPIGGLAAGLGAGGRGIAQYAGRTAAVEGLREPVELLFQEAAKQAPAMGGRIAQTLLGVGAAAIGTNAAANPAMAGLSEAELAQVGTKDAQAEIQRRFQERGARYGEAQEAKRMATPTLPPGMTFSDITSHPDFNNPAAFKAKFGMLPEDAMNLIQKRSQSHPTGTFRRGF